VDAATSFATAPAVFDERIKTREARLGIVGLGYAGLPLAILFADAGFHVTGIDLDEDRVRWVNEGRSYLVDVPPERYEAAGDRLSATSDYAVVSELDAVTICVPTPLSKTRTPDISYVVSAGEALARHLRPGQLVILQSTTYPGTTLEILLPILEADGRKAGKDFFLGYAPERVDPGNGTWTIRTTPKLVAGVTEECRRRTQAVYAEIVDTVVPVSSPTVVGERARGDV
jgi:UDP-N-acetyl-D-glucosamine dehydrogenase